jgi:hypothetical protein
VTDEDKRTDVCQGGFKLSHEGQSVGDVPVDLQQDTLNLPAAAWKIKAPVNDERASLLARPPPSTPSETSLKSKLSMVVKKVACICLPSQMVFDPAMVTDIEASQPQAISPELGSLDSCMHPGSLRQDCFVLTGAYQKLVLVVLGNRGYHASYG